jgi:hypothetical protein
MREGRREGRREEGERKRGQETRTKGRIGQECEREGGRKE